MGNRERIHFAGAVYHAVSHSIEEIELFTSDEERSFFLTSLRKYVSEAGAALLAYCLMDNHIHLAIRVGEIPLSAIMQRLLLRYSVYFNRRHDRKGHVFKDRYYPVLCKDDVQLAVMIRYIHMNPVKAGAVSHPRLWEWSSYRDLEASGVDGLMPSSADSEALLAALESYDPMAVKPERIPALSLLRDETTGAVDFPTLASAIAAESGFTVEELLARSKRRSLVRARETLIDAATKAGMRPTQIAKALGVTVSIVTRALAKRTNVSNV